MTDIDWRELKRKGAFELLMQADAVRKLQDDEENNETYHEVWR